MKRVVASLLLASQLLSPLARAPLAHAEETTCRAEIYDVIDQYIEAYEQTGQVEFSRIRRDVMKTRVTDYIFQRPGSDEYVMRLRAVDEYSAVAPDAIYDLAKELQSRWVQKYAAGLGMRHNRRARAGMQIGLMAMVSMMAVMTIKQPRNVGRYFQLVRTLAPMAPVAGAFAGEAASGMLDDKVPLSPAHVMKLGIETEENAAQATLDADLIREFKASAASFAAGGFAYDILAAAKFANRASSAAKVNPVAFVASLVVGHLVNEKAERWLDDRARDRLASALKASIAEVEKAREANAPEVLYAAAADLVERATAYAHFLNLPLLKAAAEFGAKASKAESKYGRGSTQAVQAIAEAQTALVKATEAFQRKTGNPYFWDHQAQQLVDYLKVRGFDAINQVNSEAKARAGFLLQGFERKIRFAERRKGSALTAPERDAQLATFLDGLAKTKNEQLAQEFVAGDWRADGYNVVLQAIAYLKSLDVDFLEVMISDLAPLIPEYQVAVAAAEATDSEEDLR